MAELRYIVFGRLVAVAATPAGRKACLLGQDGKPSPMNIVIPAFVDEDDVGQYLADLLHELATPTSNKVVRLSPN